MAFVVQCSTGVLGCGPARICTLYCVKKAAPMQDVHVHVCMGTADMQVNRLHTTDNLSPKYRQNQLPCSIVRL